MKHAEIIFGLASQSFFYDPPEMFQPSGTPTVQVWLSTCDDTQGTVPGGFIDFHDQSP